MTKILIGADTSNDKEMGALIADAFKGAKFPVTITIENLAPRNFSFPELGVPMLRSALSRTPETKAVVKVESFDVLQRAMSSVEQIAQFNDYKVAVVLQEVKEAGKKSEKTPEPEDKGKAKPKKE